MWAQQKGHTLDNFEYLQLIERNKNNSYLQDFEKKSTTLAEPSLVMGLGILFGTIIEDFATLGAGVADDPVTIGIGLSFIACAFRSDSITATIVQSKIVKKESDSLVTLYRAVNIKELNSIKNSGGKFTMGDESTYEVGKLFQTNPLDAYGYAKLANQSIAEDDPYVAVVATSAPKDSYIPINSIIDAPSAVIVPEENLSLLSPPVINTIGELICMNMILWFL
ncbi:MAG: hypothetical protein PUC37_07275 [Spirochaetales bacterium]|nr:hypothetical protein [Spirochaetales bacterium]